MPALAPFLHDPLVLFVLGALYVLGRDFVVGFLRRDAEKKLADKDPSNDAIAHAELSAADAITKLPIGKR